MIDIAGLSFIACHPGIPKANALIFACSAVTLVAAKGHAILSMGGHGEEVKQIVAGSEWRFDFGEKWVSLF